jgi:hypothetical protein
VSQRSLLQRSLSNHVLSFSLMRRSWVRRTKVATYRPLPASRPTSLTDISLTIQVVLRGFYDKCLAEVQRNLEDALRKASSAHLTTLQQEGRKYRHTRKLKDQHFNTSPRSRTITQISTPPYEHIIVNRI